MKISLAPSRSFAPLAAISAITLLAAAAGLDAAPPTGPQAVQQWWAFRPLAGGALPAVRNAGWVKTPVDRFILAALEKKGLSPTPAVDRRKLIRRVTFDVIGLPPKPEEVEAFVRDPDPKAYEKLVDRLLASPHYGERWGRHWLDVARYADSDGQESDHDRPTACHYRDFVIRSLNDDLPFDTFARWQIAGDEYDPVREADRPRAIAATGFLTAGPHAVLDSVPMEEEKIRTRFDELDDIVATTGKAFLGLTIGCARCHDHKYDPIPTKDYYRLLTAFNGGDRAEVPLAAPAAAAEWRKANSQWKAELDAAQKELNGWLTERKQRLDKPLREARIAALPISAEEKALLRGSSQDARARGLARKFARELKVEDGDYRAQLSDAERSRWDELAAQVKQVEGRKPAALATALAQADFGSTPRQTFLFDRGDFHVKKEPVTLGFLTTLTAGKTPEGYWAEAKAAGSRGDTTYQRRALAEWMTDTRHGSGALLARVIVNRVWQHHFGEGLVRSVNDFGRQGELPSHPELLEYLAWALSSDPTVQSAGRVESGGGRVAAAPGMGWKLKGLHRLILTSAVYQQDTTLDANKARIDPENRLLWRRRPRRIEAEILRDSMLAVSGQLNPEQYGPAVKAPIQSEAIQARNVKTPYPRDLKDSPQNHRRSVYMFHKRVVPQPLLQAFDGPDAASSCGRRNVTTVAPQALALLNEPFVRLRAVDFARRLIQEAGEEPAEQVRLGFRLAVGRQPDAGELAASLRFIQDQKTRRTARTSNSVEVRLATLTDFAQVLFGLNEFVYVD